VLSERQGILRCLVATVAPGRASVQDDVTGAVIGDLQASGFAIVRSVTVNREKEYIDQLLLSVVVANEADAVVLIGGAGIGPRDYACEAIDQMADRRIEGFGEEYRRLQRQDHASLASVVLSRATAGVYNGCVLVALPRQSAGVARRAVQELVGPILARAAEVATGAAAGRGTARALS
jgi:molybdenum cofactor biosynthesis protein B